MPPRRNRRTNRTPESADDDFEPSLVKQITRGLHDTREAAFLDRFRTGPVAVYVGNPDRYMNAHLADFPGMLDVDALVFVELHRKQALVERTVDNLPQFEHLPITITSASCRPFLRLETFLASIECLELRVDEALPRKILVSKRLPRSWALMVELSFTQGDVEKKLPVLVTGQCSALHVFAFLAREAIPVTRIIEPDIA